MSKFSKEELVQGILNYFETEQWKKAYDMIRSPEIDHIHVYVDSVLNPYTIDEIFVQYLIKEGYHFSKKPYHGAIQDIKLSSNIEADDLPPFEIFNYFNADVVLSPQHNREEPEYWTSNDVEEFFSKYNFKEINDQEKQELVDYFTSSKQWREAMELLTSEDMEHLHINIESKVHPKVIEQQLYKAFNNIGWVVNKIEHMIFSPTRLPKDQKKFYGKIMVMLKKPDITRFDIAWIFNPGVLVKPSTEFIANLDGVPEFDIGGTKQRVERYISLHDFVTLSKQEIKNIFK